MHEQGFMNYNYECWHFGYGDQMYVMMRNFVARDDTHAAWYGSSRFRRAIETGPARLARRGRGDGALVSTHIEA